jgi:hypothetical protein
MTRRKLAKLRGEIVAMRRSPQKARALEALAERLGRAKVKRGKEPMWENGTFPHLPPLAIPHHGGGRDLATGTKNNILSQLEDDVIEWDDWLTEQGDDGEEDDD